MKFEVTVKEKLDFHKAALAAIEKALEYDAAGLADDDIPDWLKTTDEALGLFLLWQAGVAQGKASQEVQT